MLIDTHCHLAMIAKTNIQPVHDYKNCSIVKNIINDAQKSGVSTIINIGTTYDDSLENTRIAQAFSNIFCTVGIHPCDGTSQWREDFEKIKKLVVNKTDNKIIGIGETGLDFYHPNFIIEQQKSIFKAHIELALEHNLPLVIHTRHAIDETLSILESYKKEPLKGVIHCFSESWSIAQNSIEMGFFLGIGGIITYPKNNALREVVVNDSLAHCILETDAPFLPPQHMRGKQNSPAQIAHIAEFIAELLATDIEHVANTTTHNARTLFALPT